MLVARSFGSSLAGLCLRVGVGHDLRQQVEVHVEGVHVLYSELVERGGRRRVHQLVAEGEDVSPSVATVLGFLVGEQADGPGDDGEGGGVDGEGAQEGRGQATGEGTQALLCDAHLHAV